MKIPVPDVVVTAVENSCVIEKRHAHDTLNFINNEKNLDLIFNLL